MNTHSRVDIRDTSLGCLRHPLTWLAIALLVINDHFLKALLPSWLTGKLSDFAGLFFFPFVLAALLSLPLDRLRASPRKAGSLAIFATGACFTLIKTIPAINVFSGEVVSGLIGYRAAFALDPTDLLALSMLLPAWWLWNRPAPAPGRPKRWGWATLVIAATAALASTPPAAKMGIMEIEAGLPYQSISCTPHQPLEKDAWIQDIEVAPTGQIWVGSSLSVARFEPADQSWQAFNLPVGKWSVNQISLGPDNAPWVSTWPTIQDGRGPVFRFDGQSFTRVPEVEAVITDTIQAIAFDPNGTIWFGTIAGAYRWKQGTNEWQHFTEKDGLLNDIVYQIRFTPDGTAWIIHYNGTSYQTLPVGSEKLGPWNTYSEHYNARRDFIYHYYPSAVSQDGRIWFGGERLYDPETRQWLETAYTGNPTDIAIDSQGGLWIAQGSEHGVLFISGPLSSPREQWQQYGQASGLSDDTISSMAAGSDNTIWLGATQGMVLHCLVPGVEPSYDKVKAYALYSGGYSNRAEQFDSIDGGVSWSHGYDDKISEALANRQAVSAQWTLRDPNNDSILYRFTRQESIARSTDSGATWTTEIVLRPWTQAQEALYAARVGSYQASPSPTDAEIERRTGNVIVGMGLEGVLVRTADAQWQWVAVGSYERVEPRGAEILSGLVLSAVLAVEIWSGLALVCFSFGLGFSTLGYGGKSLRVSLIMSGLGLGLALFPSLPPTGSIFSGAGFASLIGLGQAILIFFSGLALLTTLDRGRPGKSRHNIRLALSIALISLTAIWVPFILWSQNIIPERQTATAIALAAACALLLIQYGMGRLQPRT